MADLKDLTIESFAEITASDAPAPGGGSVSVMAASIGAALAEMVANLTIGKSKYSEMEEEMKALSAEAAVLRKELILAIQKDTESFNLYMDALSMPKDTYEQKAARKEPIQNGLKEAAKEPLSVAGTAIKIFPIAEAVVARGNSNAVTDGLVGTMMTRTGILGALLNVKINLGSIKDEAFVSDMTKKVKELEEQAIAWEKKILENSGIIQL